MSTSPAPTISLCIPIYNGEKHLRACLDSVAAQTRMPDEIILADNASRDASLSLCREFQAAHPRLPVRVAHFDALLPMGPNWNRMIALARGDWIKVVPCDDILHPDIIAAQEAVARAQPDLVLILCGKRLINGRGRALFRKPLARTGRVAGRDLIAWALGHPSNPLGEPQSGLFPRRLAGTGGGYDPALRYYVDLDFWLKLAAQGDVFLMPACLYDFRIHPTGASASLRRVAVGEYLELNRRHGSLDAAELRRRERRAVVTTWARDFAIKFLG